MSAAVETRAASPKRQAVLWAAAELFTAQGYGAVSMDAVAREAGVSKATLYAHFPGKDQLFAEIIESRLVEVRQASELVAAHELPLRQALQAMGQHWLGFMLAPRALAIFRVVVAEGARFPDLARAFHESGPRKVLAWAAGWIAEEARRGRLRADLDPAVAAEQMVGMLRGDLYLRCVLGLSTPAEPELTRVAEAAADSFLRAYGGGAAD